MALCKTDLRGGIGDDEGAHLSRCRLKDHNVIAHVSAYLHIGECRDNKIKISIHDKNRVRRLKRDAHILELSGRSCWHIIRQSLNACGNAVSDGWLFALKRHRGWLLHDIRGNACACLSRIGAEIDDTERR